MSANWQQFSQGWNQNTGWNQNQNHGWDQNQNQWHQNNSNHNWNIDNNTGNTYNTNYQPQPMQPQQTQHTPAHTFPPMPPPATGQATLTQTYTAARTTHQTTRNNPYIHQHQTPPQHQRMIYTPPSTTSTNTPHTTPPNTQQSTPNNPSSSTQATPHNTQPQTLTSQTGNKHTTPHYVAIPDKWTQTTEHITTAIPTWEDQYTNRSKHHHGADVEEFKDKIHSHYQLHPYYAMEVKIMLSGCYRKESLLGLSQPEQLQRVSLHHNY